MAFRNDSPPPVDHIRPPAGRSLSWTVFQALTQIGVRAASLVLLSWLLSPVVFGEYGIMLSVTLILATVAQMGIPTNLICLGTVGRASFAAAAMAGLTASVLMTVAYAGIVLVLVESIGAELSFLLLVCAPYVLLQVLLNILDALARRIFAFRAIALCELAGAAVGNLLLALVLAYQGWGVWSLAAGQLVAALVQVAGLLHVCRGFLGIRTNAEELRRILSASLAVTVAEVANIATVYAQRPLVGAVLGPAAAGLWARFYQIILLQLTCLIQPVDKLVTPVLSRHRTASELTKETMLTLIELVGIVTIPVAVITAMIAPWAVVLAFGDAWEGLILPLQLGSITLFFRGVDRILLSAARATGHIGPRAIIQVGQFLVVIGAVYLAAPHGLAAVAVAYVLAQLLGFAGMLVVFGRGLAIPIRSVLRRIVPGAVCGALAFFACSALGSFFSASVPAADKISQKLGLAVLSVLIASAAYRWGISTTLKTHLSKSFRPFIPGGRIA